MPVKKLTYQQSEKNQAESKNFFLLCPVFMMPSKDVAQIYSGSSDFNESEL